MKIIINIPEDFEQEFQTDRFESSLYRLSGDAHLLAGNYEKETATMLIYAFKTAVNITGHGRLIDAFDTVKTFCDKGLYMHAEIVSDMPTVIPADKTEECE